MLCFCRIATWTIALILSAAFAGDVPERCLVLR